MQFVARGRGYSLLLTSGGPVASTSSGLMRMHVVGARLTRPEVLQPLPGVSNYFIGRDRTKWRRHVPNYARVRYRDVYPGVDQVYYGSTGRLEYDFIVASGADPNVIRLEFPGACEVNIDAAGNLLVRSGSGTIRHHRPIVYQENNGLRQTIPGSYVSKGKGRIGFHVGDYDRGRPLVIDPVMQFSMFIGGGGIDEVDAMVQDPAGNFYLGGISTSPDIALTPQVKPKPTNIASYGDAFIVALNPTATAVLFTTYIGGQYGEVVAGLGLDAAGNIYAAGTTNSDDLPVTPGVYQPKFAGGFGSHDTTILGDAFVAKFNPTGDTLQYLTYLGGPSAEECFDLAVDASGNAYVVGSTRSVMFPTTSNAAFKYGGDVDGFLTKLNSTGTALLYSTFIGGSGTDIVSRIALDATGNVYLTGVASLVFPTTSGAFQKVNAGSGDAFVMKLDTAGKVIFSTLLGGQGLDTGTDLKVDGKGNVYVAGSTTSQNFPLTPGAPQAANLGVSNAFLAKLDPTGGSLQYSTLLGGSGHETSPVIALDADGSVYLAATTDSAGIPTSKDALQTRFKGAYDVLLAKLDASGKSFPFITYFGGQGMDFPMRMLLDSAGNLIIAGITSSADFPVKSPLAQIYNGGPDDGFLTKLVFTTPLLSLSSQTASFQYTIGGDSPAPQSIAVSTNSLPAGITVQTSGETWLNAAQSAAATPAAVKITVNPASLAAGQYAGAVTIASKDVSNSPLAVNVTLTVNAAPPPPVVPVVIVNSVAGTADGMPGPVAAGQLITISGAGMGPAATVNQQLNAAGLVDTTLAGTRVFFDGIAAPLISVSAGKIATVVPYAVDGKTTTQLQVQYQNVSSDPLTLAVAPAVPAIFTADSSGQGQALAFNQDSSPNSAGNPAAPGSVVVLYATGAGQTDPAGVDGLLAKDVLPKPVLPVTATVGGSDAEVVSASSLFGAVAGMLQVSVRLPDGVGTGAQDVVLQVGTAASRSGVTIAVQ